jgi:hypothetical protein
MSSTLVSGRLETINICFKCFWSGMHKLENGNRISRKGKNIKRRIPNESQFAHSSMG